MFVRKNCQENQGIPAEFVAPEIYVFARKQQLTRNTFRHFIPRKTCSKILFQLTQSSTSLGKWEPVQTLQRFDKNSPFQKNMTVYSRKAVRKWNILTTSKSQNWLQEFHQYCEKIKLKQRAFE